MNGAALLETSLEPGALLEVLFETEKQFGRTRTERWGPRSLDLDLLLYDTIVLETPLLTVPHPRMGWRRFVLEPATEIAGAMLHPTTGWTVARLLQHLSDTPPYVALTGAIGVGKSRLAVRLSEATSGVLIAEEVPFDYLESFYRDSSSSGLALELEFLRQRTRLLAADQRHWHVAGRPSVSDFWFGQSLAFARTWLSDEEEEAFRQHWAKAREGVVRARLVVLLDAPIDVLLVRIRIGGRDGEDGLTRDVVDRIRRAIRDQTRQPDVGPVLEASLDDSDNALEEVLAAVGSW